MKSIAIFCGSAAGNNPVFIQTAQHVGRVLAENQIQLVYGGGKVGLMGAVADSVLAHGGQAIGVMPKALVDREIAHTGLSDLYVVENMHQRKMQMSELADAFIALPGGAGTLEEIYEQWTWAQLGTHAKPCAFLNVAGYYQLLLDMVKVMVEQGFTQQRYADMLIHKDNIEEILEAFRHYQAPPAKWTDPKVKP